MSRPVLLQLTGLTSLKYGGIERYLCAVSAECSRRGWSTIVQFEAPPATENIVADFTAAGARLEYFPTNRNGWSARRGIISCLRRHRPDILHVHFTSRDSLLLTPRLARLLGTKTSVSTLHGLVHDQAGWVWRVGYRAFDHIVPVSDAVARSAERGGFGRNLRQPLYLGLFGDPAPDPARRASTRAEFGIPEQAPVAACITFDARIKGVDVLMRGFALLRESVPEARLLVVGIDPRNSDLPRMADELGAGDGVIWAGIRDDAWRLFDAADVYVQPSRSEGLPLAILEAMALALPVVGSDVGGIPEAVVDGETGRLVPVEDPVALADAVQGLFADAGRRRAWGEAGRRRYQDIFKGPESVRRLVSEYYGIPELR